MHSADKSIQIEIKVERRTLRRVLAVGAALALLLAGARFSSAQAVPDSSQGSNLERRLKALENRVTLNGTYSVNATLCGATAASSTGNLGGYSGAKAMCQTTCGSSTAHMCLIDELVRSRATGKSLTPGWYATGTVDYFGSSLIDCLGYTDASQPLGPSFSTQFGFSYSACNVSQPVLCCD